MKITLSIVDDHDLFRKGLKLIICEFSQVEIVHEASNGKEILEKLIEIQTDLVLLDIDMPEFDGIYALKRIKKEFPETKVIMLSMYMNEAHVANIMRIGANGYLFKNCNSSELLEAIESVCENGFYFNDQVSIALLNSLISENNILPEFKSDPNFTAIEIQVLRLICFQLTTQEISEEICRGIRTVEGYRRSLLQKTGARNTAGLVIFAIKEGYFSLDEVNSV